MNRENWRISGKPVHILKSCGRTDEDGQKQRPSVTEDMTRYRSLPAQGLYVHSPKSCSPKPSMIDDCERNFLEQDIKH